MRLFIAAETPKEIEDYFKSIQEKIRNKAAAIVFTKTFHLTFKFLGEVDESMASKIKEELEKIKFEPFKVATSEIGFFPSAAKPRVIWIGLKNEEKIYSLQSAIDAALEKYFPPEKRFHPHLTLGRIKSVFDLKALLKKLRSIELEEKTFEIKRIYLFKSTLTRYGPIYEKL